MDEMRHTFVNECRYNIDNAILVSHKRFNSDLSHLKRNWEGTAVASSFEPAFLFLVEHGVTPVDTNAIEPALRQGTVATSYSSAIRSKRVLARSYRKVAHPAAATPTHVLPPDALV